MLRPKLIYRCANRTYSVVSVYFAKQRGEFVEAGFGSRVCIGVIDCLISAFRCDNIVMRCERSIAVSHLDHHVFDLRESID
jgi:hypothetical protein